MLVLIRLDRAVAMGLTRRLPPPPCLRLCLLACQYGPHDEKIKAHAARITDLLYEEDEEDDFREEAPGGGGGGGQQLLGGFTFGGASEAAGRGRGRHLNVPAWQTANWGASSHAS